VTANGLRTRKRNKLSAQTFHFMSQKAVYYGYPTASFLEKPVKGLYEPLVTETLFRTVHDVLSGRRRSVAPKTRRNPNFPLNCFVRCRSCGTPITGGLVTGKQEPTIRLLLVSQNRLPISDGAEGASRRDIRCAVAPSAR
jgi:hypothetical protein